MTRAPLGKAWFVSNCRVRISRRRNTKVTGWREAAMIRAPCLGGRAVTARTYDPRLSIHARPYALIDSATAYDTELRL